MSQDDSGVHSDSTSTPPQRKRSTPVTAKELKVTWNFCPKEKKEGSLVEEDDMEKERRESKEETKGRRGSSHSWSSLGRRRSKDGGARRRSKDEGRGRITRRGSDSSIGQAPSLCNTHIYPCHPFYNKPSHGIHSSPISIHPVVLISSTRQESVSTSLTSFQPSP